MDRIVTQALVVLAFGLTCLEGKKTTCYSTPFGTAPTLSPKQWYFPQQPDCPAPTPTPPGGAYQWINGRWMGIFGPSGGSTWATAQTSCGSGATIASMPNIYDYNAAIYLWANTNPSPDVWVGLTNANGVCCSNSRCNNKPNWLNGGPVYNAKKYISMGIYVKTTNRCFRMTKSGNFKAVILGYDSGPCGSDKRTFMCMSTCYYRNDTTTTIATDGTTVTTVDTTTTTTAPVTCDDAPPANASHVSSDWDDGDYDTVGTNVTSRGCVCFPCGRCGFS